MSYTKTMTMRKKQWQRDDRATFKEKHGYSRTAHYGAGGLRRNVLERDGYRCVRCGMTDAQHKDQWGRPITIDHIDRNRARSVMDNLQTLCLVCHSRKDIVQELHTPRVPAYQEQIIQWRADGATYQAIADELGFSIGAIWKWVQRWKEEYLCRMT